MWGEPCRRVVGRQGYGGVDVDGGGAGRRAGSTDIRHVPGGREGWGKAGQAILIENRRDVHTELEEVLGEVAGVGRRGRKA